MYGSRSYLVPRAFHASCIMWRMSVFAQVVWSSEVWRPRERGAATWKRFAIISPPHTEGVGVNLCVRRKQAS